MKILVPVKRVPDPYGRMRLTADGSLDESDIKWVLNPFDAIALEEAVRVRERRAGETVEIIAVTVGAEVCEEQLRAALAMGADRAYLVEADQPTEPSFTAALLAAIFRRETPDLILMGKQAIDDDCSQTGPQLAALLNLPQACFASQVELSPAADTATVTREVEAGRETLRVRLPAVITADLRLNEPRYVALPAIIKARSKPIARIAASELGVNLAPALRLIKLETPPPRRAGRRVASVQELLKALHGEAGVL